VGVVDAVDLLSFIKD
jgi:hypothetical protein